MVEHTQTIRRQIADELFECVWPFCEIGAKRIKTPINVVMNSGNRKIKFALTFFFILPILIYVIFTGLYKTFDVYIYLMNNKHQGNENPVDYSTYYPLPNPSWSYKQRNSYIFDNSSMSNHLKKKAVPIWMLTTLIRIKIKEKNWREKFSCLTRYPWKKLL